MITKIQVLLVSFFICSSVVFAQSSELKKERSKEFQNALSLYTKGKYVAAQKQFAHISEVSLNNLEAIEAEYYYASSALKLGLPNAELLFLEFIAKYPENKAVQKANRELAQHYYNQKNYKKSVEYYQKVDFNALTKKDKFETNFQYGYSLFVEKDLDAAEPVFDEIKKTENAYKYAAHYYSGYIKFKKEKYDEAIVDFEESAKNEAYASVVPYMLVQIYHHKGDFEKLISYAEDRIANDKNLANKAEILLLKANAFYEIKNFDKAEEDFNTYLTVNKTDKDPQIFFRLGYCQLHNQKYDLAVQSLKNVINVNDTIAQYSSYYLALASLKLEDTEMAKAALTKAVQLNINPEVTENALYNLIKVTFDKQDFTNCIDLSKQYTSTFPKGPHKKEVNKLLAFSYLNTNNYKIAIEYIESQDNSDELADVYQKLTFYFGVELFNRAQYSDAIDAFQKSISSSKDYELKVRTYFWLAETYSLIHQNTKAYENYAIVLKTGMSNRSQELNKAHYGIAYIYFNDQNYSEAQKQFTSFIEHIEDPKKEPFYGDALLRIADCYFYKKDFQKAISNYEMAIFNKVKALDYAYYQKGVVLNVVGKDLINAKASLSYVASNFPHSVYAPKALYQIAKISFEHSQFDLAIQDFSQFIAKEKSHKLLPLARLQRGLSYYNLNNYKSALADYDYILTNFCSEKIATQALSLSQQTLSMMGKSDEFNSRLDKFESCNPEIQDLEKIRYEAAVESYRAGNNETAVNNFSSFLQKYPSSANVPEAIFYLAESYYGVNNPDSAIGYYETVVQNGPEKHKEKSLLRLGTITILAKQYQKSLKYNHQLLNVVTSKRKQLEALSGLMKTYYFLEKYDSSLYYTSQILTEENRVLYIRQEAELYVAKNHLKLGEPQAMDECINLMGTANNEYGAEANYTVAQMFYDQKDYKQAIELCTELIKNFETLDLWVGKGYLLISDSYIGLEEFYQAEATLSSISEKFPIKSISVEAKLKLEKLRSSLPQGSTSESEIEPQEMDQNLMKVEMPEDTLNVD